MKTIQNLFVLIVLILSISCDRPNCKNSNPIFEKFPPESDEYKSELADKIGLIGIENLDYWFDKYHMTNNKEFIEVFVQNDSLCAKAILEVNDWSKIKGLRQVNNGYSGAKLNGLTMRIEKVGIQTRFILENLKSIDD